MCLVNAPLYCHSFLNTTVPLWISPLFLLTYSSMSLLFFIHIFTVSDLLLLELHNQQTLLKLYLYFL